MKVRWYYITQKIYNYWLSKINGIGAVKIRELLNFFGSAESIYRADKATLEEKTKLKEKDIDAIINSRDYDELHRGYEKLIRNEIKLITIDDLEYPEKLRNIYAAPFALYVKGKLPPMDGKNLAVVGARECSAYGMEVAKYMAGMVAKQGISIISGLARGIDAYAHMGALSVDGITYGILGCGIDICYPKENIQLYMDMQNKGGIISEFAPGVAPLACNFPMRNRIISGLSDGILVIEAREKSGSLITVDMGLEQGKDIYAIPGRITDRLSGGCNNLIKMGAKLVTSPQDILEELQLKYTNTNQDDNLSIDILDSEEQKIIDTLNLIPKHIEEIALETNISLSLLMEKLLDMELKNIIKQSMKNYYVAVRHH